MIDGDSLNDTATKIGGMTGENGSKIINVTRPDAHGTKVAITAALYDNASAMASIDTIFTVVTSPDSDKAKMWGHMPETTTAANGGCLSARCYRLKSPAALPTATIRKTTKRGNRRF